MKPSAIFLCIVFLLAAVSCGKEKDNSHVPSGRVAHMTVTQHTPDTAYRLEYTFEWQDTLLECVKCLLSDGRTERMECRYSGTRLTETAVYTADGAMRERWIYTYSGDRLARQTLTMEGCSAECTFRYEGSRPVGISAGNTTTNAALHGRAATCRKRASGRTARRCSARHSDTAIRPTPYAFPSEWNCPPAGA